MATASLTTSPTTIAAASDGAVYVTNTGTTRVTIVNGTETTYIRRGRGTNIVPTTAVTAKVLASDGGTGSIVYEVTAVNTGADLVRANEIDPGAVSGGGGVTGDGGAALSTATAIAADPAFTATYARKAADWATGVAYAVGELVVSSGTLYRCTTAHTSSGSFASGNFTALGGGGGSTVTIDADGTLVVNGTTVEVATDAEMTAAIAAAVSTKANIASPTFTGTPAAPTAPAGTSTTQIATTAFVATATGASIHTASVSGAATINAANGAVQRLTLTGNATFSLTGAAAGSAVSLTVILVQDATGGRTVTWPGSVDWGSGGAPVLSTAGDADDVVTLMTIDGGTKWFGFATSLTTGGGGGGVAFSGSKAYLTANQTLGNNSVTPLPMNGELWDVDGWHDIATNNTRFTVPAGQAGYVQLIGQASFGSNATGCRQVRWRKNGAEITGSYVTTAAAPTLATILQSSVIDTAAVGDYFEFCAYQDSGATLVGCSWAASVTRLG